MCGPACEAHSHLCFALQPPEQPPYPHHQGGPPHCPPWNNSHEGMWGEQRGDPGWNGQRDAPWNNQPDPNWNSQFEGPWNNQHEQPPWGGGQREPPFRMQRPPHFRGPFPPHQQHPQFNQPPHPHNFNRFPPRFMQDDFPPRHPFERPPYPHRFDYPQGDFPAGECQGSGQPEESLPGPQQCGVLLACCLCESKAQSEAWVPCGLPCGRGPPAHSLSWTPIQAPAVCQAGCRVGVPRGSREQGWAPAGRSRQSSEVLTLFPTPHQSSPDHAISVWLL
jgi:hypothetical protein